MKRSLIIFWLSFLSINCILENKKELNLTINGIIDTPVVGKKGTILVEAQQDNDPPEEFKDFSKKIWLTIDISDNNSKKKHTLECGIWNSNFLVGILEIFCNVNETVPAGNYTLLINDIETFDYKDYTVNIHLREGEQFLDFQKFDKDVLDIYSGEQTITLEEGKEDYEVKFNIVSYHQERLHFEYNYIVDNCEAQQNNILVCHVTKKFLLEFIEPDDHEITVWYLNPIFNQVVDAKLVPYIKVVVPEMERKHIYVGITKLLTTANGNNAPIAYETNVTDVNNFYGFGPVFGVGFMNKNSEGTEKEIKNNCRFGKYDNNPLMLICWVNTEGTNWLKETTEEQILDKQNYQYIYHLLPYKIKDIIETKGEGSYIFWHYPKVLDFTKNNDALSLDIDVRDPQYFQGLTFNENEADLKCELSDEEVDIFSCKVPKDHFKGKKSGEYFIKRNDHKGNKFASYDHPPVKVILPDIPDKGNVISSSLFYSLLSFLILI